jgi:hypothetical protein
MIDVVGFGQGETSVLMYPISTLLQTGTVATGRKLLWPRAISPSLQLRPYNDITVATSRRRPLLLWSVVATGTVTSAAYGYYRPQQRQAL